MGCLTGFRRIDAGQAHVQSSAGFPHAQGVTIPDGDNCGAAGLGQQRHRYER